MARKTSEPPQDVLDQVKELSEKAGFEKPVKSRVIEKGSTSNAYAMGGSIYIGRKLLETHTPKELEFILAHEISHIRANDMSERYLTWPPFVSSFFVLVSSLSAAFHAPPGTSLTSSVASVALAFAFFKINSALYNSFSRVIEYRADRNAIQLTEDFQSAARAMVKLSPVSFIQMSAGQQIYSSHPQGKDRLDNLERSAMGTNDTPYIDKACELWKSLHSRNEDDKYKIMHPYVMIDEAIAEIDSKRAAAISP
jgi:Zn-dependent protease with chaperone function